MRWFIPYSLNMRNLHKARIKQTRVFKIYHPIKVEKFFFFEKQLKWTVKRESLTRQFYIDKCWENEG